VEKIQVSSISDKNNE